MRNQFIGKQNGNSWTRPLRNCTPWLRRIDRHFYIPNLMLHIVNALPFQCVQQTPSHGNSCFFFLFYALSCDRRTIQFTPLFLSGSLSTAFGGISWSGASSVHKMCHVSYGLWYSFTRGTRPDIPASSPPDPTSPCRLDGLWGWMVFCGVGRPFLSHTKRTTGAQHVYFLRPEHKERSVRIVGICWRTRGFEKVRPKKEWVGEMESTECWYFFVNRKSDTCSETYTMSVCWWFIYHKEGTTGTT